MHIAIYHGYELTGSGSNEYTRYLSRSLAAEGHRVAVICADPDPLAFGFIGRAFAYGADGARRVLADTTRPGPGTVTVHQLPRTSVYPVFLTDQQRAGTVKAFPDLSDRELAEYHDAMETVLTAVLKDERPDWLHVNHLVYQPVIAARVCPGLGIPYYVVPHGSSIEYTVKRDPRFRALAREGLERATKLVWISREVRDRVLGLYHDLRPALEAKSASLGIGTDTALFAPVAPDQRSSSLERLVRMHRPGGKSPAQRIALRAALDAGDLDATRAYWDAYDHRLEDADLPAILASIPSDGELVLFVGALTYGKGVQTLIAAMPALLSRRPKAHLVIVGSGTYREVLEGLVHALESGNRKLFGDLVASGRDLERDVIQGGLDDLAAYAETSDGQHHLAAAAGTLAAHVHFVGRLDHARLRHLFPCCSVAAFPSIVEEASPLVFAEALANGVIPAGADHSGLRDGLDDLAPLLPADLADHMRLPTETERRVAGLARALDALMERSADPELRGELRAVAERRYDWRAIAKQLVARVLGATDL